jgi:two-component system, OmpR family, response regulator
VSRLRRKIEANPRRPVLIRTVRDGGYLLTAPVTRK